MNKLYLGAASAALLVAPAHAQSVEQAGEASQASAITYDENNAEGGVAQDVAAIPAITETALPVAAAPPAAPKTLTLPTGTPINLAVLREVNSSTHDAGDTIQLTVVDDVKIDDSVVIPRGTPAKAEITWRTGKGAFGKSGKMELALRSIDLPDGPVPIFGEFRQDGEGNTVATGVGVVAIGVFAGFITGKRARLPAGRELMAQTVVDVPFSSAGGFAGQYDGKAALEAELAATPLGQCKAEAMTIEKEKKRNKAIKKCYVKRLE